MNLNYISNRKMEGGDDGKGGGSDDGKGGDDHTPDPALEKLAEGMNALAAGMKTMQESQIAASERLANLETLGKPKDDDEDDDGKPGDVDLESLSRPEFANNIIERVGKEVNKQIKQITDTIADVQKDTGNQAVEREIEKAEGAHKDFWDWQPEIQAMAKENPGVSIERLYTLARNEHPDKVKELDKKYEKSDGKGEPSKNNPFGGLTPTSSTTENNEKMDKKSAADKAYEETMGNFPVSQG